MSDWAVDPGDVQTPREVYAALAKEGFKVDYYRIPITDGSSPRESIFDQFYQAIWPTRSQDRVIFNCQMGAGRTTMGMVIACLIRARKFGKKGSLKTANSLALYMQSTTVSGWSMTWWSPS